ncbi:MAG TPA: alpha/beta hydrolase [Acidobacteriaceae bacterium]|jgi:pimeloyl-ACP methyl ester carboxylesterase
MVERRTVVARGLRLSYLERGPSISRLDAGARDAHEPSLVLIHGLMGTAEVFLPLIDAIPAERHVIALDLPGAGGSERRRKMPATLAAASESVIDALDALGLEQPVLVGHSHGAAVAMYLTSLYPERVDRLVLLSPAHPYFSHADQLIRFYLSPLGKAFAHTIPWYPQWLQMVGLRSMAGPRSWDSPERLAPYRRNLRTQGTVPHLLRLLRTWQTDMAELRSLLECPFRKPALVIWGDHDRAVPVSTAEALMHRLMHGELRVMEGVGHRPAEERPQTCAAMIEEWMAETAAVRHAKARRLV